MRHFFRAGEVLPNLKTTGIHIALLSILCLVSMFSLSAQTPRQESGANGPVPIVPLRVGDYVPEDFWHQKMKVYYKGDTAVFSFEKYKGKSLILDFWATWCTYCVQGFPKIAHAQRLFQDHVNILLVNERSTHDDYAKIHNMRSNQLKNFDLYSIYRDEYLTALFPHGPIPHYVWINPKGRVAAITFAEFVSLDQLQSFIAFNLKYENAN
ncbi:TlpA family protein disulfide reductase [Sphingobacterium sp. N143]|uniref:TlpA family protein disulfide reductase n=1 Tax=Sphingobacterium sp. N143 TaxID=2746727 RepID=UPI002578167B|nr:TlpA disulfide reductase family protein [Sphingobacterium sp. N143]MDM1296817.1 TlpA family protein disulfide reductase [Sphingobacterium sp. N143]